MIWVALLLGIVIGGVFVGTMDWIAIDPTHYRKKLEAENAALKVDNATLRAQLEALDSHEREGHA